MLKQKSLPNRRLFYYGNIVTKEVERISYKNGLVYNSAMRVLWILLVIICLGIQPASAAQKLSLGEAINLALEKNHDLAQSRKDIEIASNNIKIANRLQNPKIETMFLLGRISQGNPHQVGLSVPVEVMKRGPRKAKALSEQRLALSNTDLEAFNLKMSVRDAYVRLAAAKSVLKIVEDQQKVMQGMVELTQKRCEEGKAEQVELMQAKIMYKQLEMLYNQALNQVDVQTFYFNKVLNVEENSAYDIADEELPQDGEFLKLMTPSPDLPLIDFEKIKQLAFKNRFDIIISQNEIDVAKDNLKVVMSQRIPDINLRGGYAYLTAYQNNEEVDGHGAVSGAYVGGEMDLPLLYKYTPEIQNARLELEKKELNKISIKNSVVQELKKAYGQFELARKNLNYYREELLETSAKTLKSTEENYAKGKTDLSNLILMEQAHMGIMMNYIDALSCYYTEWIELLTEINVEELL